MAEPWIEVALSDPRWLWSLLLLLGGSVVAGAVAFGRWQEGYKDLQGRVRALETSVRNVDREVTQALAMIQVMTRPASPATAVREDDDREP